MSNYMAYMRSNYFKVKDIKAFKEDIVKEKILGITFNENNGEDIEIIEKDGEIVLLGYCGIPYWKETDNGDEMECDFPKFIQKHLVIGETCELMEIGSEKLRYLNAIKYTITSKGIKEETLEIS